MTLERRNFNIIIKFNEWSRKNILLGKKLATTRTKHHGKVGDRFKVADKWFELISVERMTLGEVTSKYYAIEGAESPEEFKEIWIGIHPRARWNPDKSVLVHFFKPVESGYDNGLKGTMVRE